MKETNIKEVMFCLSPKMKKFIYKKVTAKHLIITKYLCELNRLYLGTKVLQNE